MKLSSAFFVLPFLQLSASNDADKQVRRSLIQSESCLLVLMDKRLADNKSIEKWTCELLNADAQKAGIQFVELEGLDESDLQYVVSGVSTLLADGAEIANGKLKLSKGSKKTFGKMEGRGPAARAKQGKKEGSRMLMPMPAVDEKKVLAVRVVTNDASTTSSRDVISDKVFGTDGDKINLKERYETCSYGTILMEPFSGQTTTEVSIANGVYEVVVNVEAQGNTDAAVRDAVLNQLRSDLGDLRSQFDYVMLCIPPGTGGWVAYAWLNYYLSVYNDAWCNSPSAQMHELGHNLGLQHAGEEAKYDDQVGMMGYSDRDDSTTKCFNPAKSWQLGWYSSQRIDLDFDTRSVFQGRLIGIADYQSTGAATGSYVNVRIPDGTLAEKNYYVGFNYQGEGMNKDTLDAINLVTVHTQIGEEASNLVGKINFGNYYIIKNFKDNNDLIIEVTDIDISADVPFADVHIYLSTSATVSMEVQVLTDNYPQETSWAILDVCNDDAVVISGDSYTASGTIYTKGRFRFLTGSKYTFKIYDSYGDGICCQNGYGSYSVTLDGETVGSGGSFEQEDSFTFGGECEVSQTPAPTVQPTPLPTVQPTPLPTVQPTSAPTVDPTVTPAPVPGPATWQTIFTEDFEDGGSFDIFAKPRGSRTRISNRESEQGDYSLRIIDGDESSYAYTPQAYDVTSYGQLKMDFFFLPKRADAGESFFLEWSSDDGNSWEIVHTFTKRSGSNWSSNGQWYERSVEWNVGSQDYIQVRFRTEFSQRNEKVFIDNVTLQGK